MFQNIHLSTYIYCAMSVGIIILHSTDYFNGKYDPLGPYPRNPKREKIDDDVKKVLEMQKYDNIRRPLFVPIVNHTHPFATPENIHRD